jgi:hypothetical protein
LPVAQAESFHYLIRQPIPPQGYHEIGAALFEVGLCRRAECRYKKEVKDVPTIKDRLKNKIIGC